MSQQCIKINRFLYVAHSFVLAIKVNPVSHIMVRSHKMLSDLNFANFLLCKRDYKCKEM